MIWEALRVYFGCIFIILLFFAMGSTGWRVPLTLTGMGLAYLGMEIVKGHGDLEW